MRNLDDMNLGKIIEEKCLGHEDVHGDNNQNQGEIKKEDIYNISSTGRKKLIHNLAAEYIAYNYQLSSTKNGRSNIYYIYENGFWKDISDNEVRKIIQQNLDNDFTDSAVRSILKLLTDLIFVREEAFNANNNLINLNNGTFNLSTFEFKNHNTDDFLTYKNDYDYDPEARCPEFESALEKYSQPKNGMEKDQEWIDLFWEILGFCLTGSYEYNKMFWFYGAKGGNGKSTLLKVFTQLVGEELTKSNFESEKLSKEFYKVSLIGMRLAITGDLPAKIFNIATIKELTGGDRQSSDRKFGSMIEFVNYAKLVFAMNKLPDLPQDINFEPIKRRLIILPFEYQIQDRIKNIDDIFRKELPGIFNKAIEGLKRLRKNQKFTCCSRGIKLLDMYAMELNIFEAFIQECIEIHEEMFVLSNELWDEYEYFMNENAPRNWLYQKEFITSKRTLTMLIKKKFDITEVENINCKTKYGKRGGYLKLPGIKFKR